jgi:hypothetical protein
VVFHTVLNPIELGQVLSLVREEDEEFGYFHQVGGMLVFQKGVVPESNLFNSTPDYNRWA